MHRSVQEALSRGRRRSSRGRLGGTRADRPERSEASSGHPRRGSRTALRSEGPRFPERVNGSVACVPGEATRSVHHERPLGTSVAMGTSAKDRKWSQRVTEKSDALDMEDRVFTWKDPRRIARSLKRSAERSTRRKGTPLQSAMSMLNFYINRAGKDLDASQRKVLNEAKDELRSLFNKKTA